MWSPDRDALRDKIAVVAGATVVCTGRSSSHPDPSIRSDYDRPETIEETAELVNRLGGVGVAVQVDHLDARQVGRLAERLRADYGHLDVRSTTYGAQKFSKALRRRGIRRSGTTTSTPD